MDFLLQLLEWLSRLPGEVWLIPPVVIIGGVFGVAMIRRQLLINNWENVARRLNLKLDAANPFTAAMLQGDYRGRPVTMQVVSRRGTWRRGDGVRVTVRIDNPAFVRLNMRRQDVVDTLLLSAGAMQDVTTGDEAFDKHYLVYTDQPEAVRGLFSGNEPLRRGLLESGIYRVHLVNDDLWVDTPSVLRQPDQVERVLNTASDLADAIGAVKPRDEVEIIRT